MSSQSVPDADAMPSSAAAQPLACISRIGTRYGNIWKQRWIRELHAEAAQRQVRDLPETAPEAEAEAVEPLG